MTAITPERPVVLAWQRMGPYHHARTRALAARLPLVAVEASSVDRVYAWDKVQPDLGLEQHRLCAGDIDRLSAGELRQRVVDCCEALRPSVLLLPGWHERWLRHMLCWATAAGVPAVLMSASIRGDKRRGRPSEWFKARVAGNFSGAIVGGRLAADYVVELGMAETRVTPGYDAVDNAHFADCVDSGAIGHAAWRQAHRRFFLCSGRFVECGIKNHLALIEAYRLYRQNAGDNAWGLVILGDGALRSAYERRISEAELGDHVLLPGFVQYDLLPAWYQAASAFVLPSLKEPWGLVVNEAMAAGLPVLVSDRCGCVPELVAEGCNGYLLDATDPAGMAERMGWIAADPVRLAAMGARSREIVADWGTARFAEAAVAACRKALNDPRRASLLDRACLRLWASL